MKAKLTTKEKADIAKATVTMPELLCAFGLDGNARHGRIKCPIHNGANEGSFAFKDRVFHCFACGAKGGVVSFAEQYLHCGFEDALREINRMFRLWEDDPDKPVNIVRQQSLRNRALEAEKRKIQEANKKKADYAKRLELARLDGNAIRYAPKSELDELAPEFVEALQKISVQEYISEA
jgi:hypothetical protein